MSSYCLYNDELRFIFCVDPKCACTTIKSWFVSLLNVPDQSVDIGNWMRPAKSVQDAEGYTKVWFVRNPFDRLVSFYYQMVVRWPGRWDFADHNKDTQLAGLSFAEFMHVLQDLHAQGKRFQHHLQPQTRALSNTSFDAVVKIEELNKRADELMTLLGVDKGPGHCNKQKLSNWQEPGADTYIPAKLLAGRPLAYSSFWNTELMDIVRRVYAQDCEFYDAL